MFLFDLGVLPFAVPCYRRCHQMAVLPENEKVIKLDQTDEEGWVDTHHGLGETWDLAAFILIVMEQTRKTGTSPENKSIALEPITPIDNFSGRSATMICGIALIYT